MAIHKVSLTHDILYRVKQYYTEKIHCLITLYILPEGIIQFKIEQNFNHTKPKVIYHGCYLSTKDLNKPKENEKECK